MWIHHRIHWDTALLPVSSAQIFAAAAQANVTLSISVVFSDPILLCLFSMLESSVFVGCEDVRSSSFK
jgi:hypothetical protein